MGRPGTSEEVATFHVFLTSDESSFSTRGRFVVERRAGHRCPAQWICLADLFQPGRSRAPGRRRQDGGQPTHRRTHGRRTPRQELAEFTTPLGWQRRAVDRVDVYLRGETRIRVIWAGDDELSGSSGNRTPSWSSTPANWPP
jgi:hypothetical protein